MRQYLIGALAALALIAGSAAVTASAAPAPTFVASKCSLIISTSGLVSGSCKQDAPTPSTTVPPSTTTSTTAAPTTTTAPSTTVPPTTVPPSTTTTVAPAGFPNLSNTGVPAGTTLTAYTGPTTITVAGTIIDAKRITSSLTIAAPGVVIRRSEVYGNVRNPNGSSFVVEDSTLGPPSGCDNNDSILGWGDYRATRVQTRNVSEGFGVRGSNIVIEDSFIRVACGIAGNHADGIQGYQGGNNNTIRHNTVDVSGAPGENAAVFMADNTLGATITGNLLKGGGYTLRIHDDTHGNDFRATGNRIVNGGWIYGPEATDNTDCSKIVWTDNRLVTITPSYQIATMGALVGC